MKKCPYCAEKIQDAAIFCRYCGRDLKVDKKQRNPKDVTISASSPVEEKKTGFFQNKAVKASIVLTALSTLSNGFKYSFGPEFFVSLIISTIPLFFIWLGISSFEIWLFRKTGMWAILIHIGLLVVVVMFESMVLYPVNSTQPTCYKWNEITSKMAGREVCVYGVVTDIEQNEQTGQTFLYFGQRDLFFLVSIYHWKTSLEGQCFSTTGLIQLTTNKIPYIKLDDHADYCP